VPHYHAVENEYACVYLICDGRLEQVLLRGSYTGLVTSYLVLTCFIGAWTSACGYIRREVPEVTVAVYLMVVNWSYNFSQLPDPFPSAAIWIYVYISLMNWSKAATFN